MRTGIAYFGFDHHEHAALRVLLNYRQRPTRRLQQRTQFRFHKPHLLVRIAHVTQRRTHVKRPAGLTLEQHIVSAQVNLRRLARRLQLLQVPVTELALFVLLVADGLRVRNPFWNGNRVSGCCHGGLALYTIANKETQNTQEQVRSSCVSRFSFSRKGVARAAVARAALEHACNSGTLHRHGRRVDLQRRERSVTAQTPFSHRQRLGHSRRLPRTRRTTRTSAAPGTARRDRSRSAPRRDFHGTEFQTSATGRDSVPLSRERRGEGANDRSRPEEQTSELQSHSF